MKDFGKIRTLFIAFISMKYSISSNVDYDYSLNYIRGCNQYDENANVTSCFKCYPGYTIHQTIKIVNNMTLNFNTCEKCSPGCKSCSSSLECVECYQSYYLDTDLKECEKCDFGCKICNSDNQRCIKCRGPFYFDNDKDKCNSCMSDCQKCEDKKTCKVCYPGYPMSEDGTMCINLESNSREFKFVYLCTSVFGLIVILISSCYLLCDCCTIQHDTDPLDFLRYSYLIPNDEVRGSVGERGSEMGVIRNLPKSNTVRFFEEFLE